MAITSGREQFILFAVIGIMALSAIFFISTTQSDNDTTFSILDNPTLNKTFNRLQTNLTNYGDVAQEERAKFESEIPEENTLTLLIFSIVTVWQKFFALIIGVYNILVVIPASVLGVSKVIIAVFDSMVVVTLILLGWRLYRVGS